MFPLIIFLIFVIFIYLLKELSLFISEMRSINDEIESNYCTPTDQMRLFVMDGNRFPQWEKECIKNDTKTKSFINTSINIFTGKDVF
jgi:hypothetical protein